MVTVGTDPTPFHDPVAIVGLGCRFPSAPSPGAYWRMLLDGVDAVSEVPPERWNADLLYDPDPTARGKTISRWGGFLDDVAGFDWRAFRISPREARFMDPQHRLLLELGWEALEDAGMPFESVAGSATAVFVGIMWNDYAKLQARDPKVLDGYSTTGNSFAYAANRLSYMFDLKGPSVALDVQCASSLVALSLACRSLWDGEAELALAGGVNLMILPDTDIMCSRASVLSPTGSCKVWDASADGFVRGEGAGIVVLKPLQRALADEDRIYAVIRSCIASHAGKTDWIMAPSRPTQEELLRTAYARAGIDPCDVDYVELHGTGTQAGDPVEAQALGAVVGRAAGRTADRPCRVGSVKSNLGHLDSAAGVAGVIKTALAVHHRTIPPSLHLRELNPAIKLDELGLEVQTETTPWPAHRSVPIAGVTGLSFGGGHAHAVVTGLLEPKREREAPRRPYLLPLSARSPEALRLLAGAYREFLGPDGDGARAELVDVCHTAGLRRTHHEHRAAIVARSRTELLERLEALERGETRAGLRKGKAGAEAVRCVFVFSGQGRPWWGSGWELLATEPTFRAAVTEADQRLRPHARWSLLEELTRDEQRSRVTSPALGQPAMFALQIGLAQLWRSFGVEPAGVIGHTVGEVAAAWCAGILTMPAAAGLAVRRGQALEAIPRPETLAAVVAPPDEVASLVAELADRIGVVAENAPGTTVVAGDAHAVEELLERCARREVYATTLKTSEVFHRPTGSVEMDELRGDWGAQPGQIPLYSTVTGAACQGPELDDDYWAVQPSACVRFSSAVGTALDAGAAAFIELGVDPLLTGALSECLRARDADAAVIGSLRWGGHEQWMFLDGLAELFVRGGPVDLRAAQAGDGRCVSLPTHPWIRERLWIDVGSPDMAGGTSAGLQVSEHPLLGARVQLADSGDSVWQGVLDPKRLRWLDDHLVQGVRVFPGAGYLDMAAAAAQEALGWEACSLIDVEFRQALVVPDDGRQTQLTLAPATADADASFRVHSRTTPTDPWVLHVVGGLREVEPLEPGSPASDPEILRQGLREEITAETCYAELSARGEEYRAAFQGIERLWRGQGEVLAQMRAPAGIAQELGRYRLHPALGDACMHALVMGTTTSGQAGFMPVRMDAVHVRGQLTEHAHSHIRLGAVEADHPGRERADIDILGPTGETLVEIEGLHLQFLDADALQSPLKERWYYQVAWEPRPEPDVDPAQVEPATWVVLADEQGVGEALVPLLEANGDRCLVLFRDEDWLQSFVSAFQTIERTGLPPCRGVLHLWSLDAPSPEDATVDEVTDAQAYGCGATLQVLRALEAATTQARVHLITRGAQPIGSDDPLNPLQAALWGFGRSLVQERPERWGSLLDLDPRADAASCARAAAEHLAAQDGEDQCAWRGGQGLVARLAPVRVPPVGSVTAPWRPDGAYLVTGGLGDLGLAAARWMAQAGARHLVLLGRTPLPPRDTWGDASGDDGDAVASARIAAVRALESLGASVHVASVDISDETTLSTFLHTWAAEGRPKIRGVVHCAGVAPFESLEQMTLETLHGVLKPKVEGAWLLHRLLGDADVFVLYSSASGVLSSPRLAHYAAGNAFLDSLASYRRSRGQAAVSVAWGPWADVGMATRTGSGGPASLRGMRLIGVDDGLEALKRVMATGATAVAVLPIEWGEWQQAYAAAARAPILTHVIEGKSAAAGADGSDAGAAAAEATLITLLATPPTARREAVAAIIQKVLAGVLRVPEQQLTEGRGLADLGFDSLMAMEVRAELTQQVGVDLRMLELLDAVTATAVVDLVVTALDAAAVTAADPAAVRVHPADAGIVPADWVVDLLSDEEVESMLAWLAAEGSAS